MSDQTKNNNSLLVFALGVAVGAAVTYLYTNEKGQKIKDNLIKEGTKILEKFGEGMEEVEKDLQKGAKTIEEKIEPPLEQVKEELREVTAQIPHQVQEVQKKGRRFFFSKKPNSAES